MAVQKTSHFAREVIVAEFLKLVVVTGVVDDSLATQFGGRVYDQKTTVLVKTEGEFFFSGPQSSCHSALSRGVWRGALAAFPRLARLPRGNHRCCRAANVSWVHRLRCVGNSQRSFPSATRS